MKGPTAAERLDRSLTYGADCYRQVVGTLASDCGERVSS